MKRFNVYLVAILLISVFSCKKEEDQTSISEQKVLLKNGKEYEKSTILSKLSISSNIPVDSLIYNDSEKTFYILGFNLEVDPIKYLGL